MRFIGNIIWLLFGGIFIAIEYFVSGIALILTIVGIPFGIQTLKLGLLSLWPMGKKVVVREEYNSGLYVLLNILWIITGGLCICLTHLVFGVILCLTIIGIPWGKQHFKLAGLALTPFGKDLVDQ